MKNRTITNGLLITTTFILISVFFFCQKNHDGNNVVQLKYEIKIDPSIERHDYWLSRPGEIKMGTDSLVYILDQGNSRIIVLDQNLKFIRQIGRVGQGPGEMIEPTDLDLDDDNNIYVADPINSRITIFDKLGNNLNTIRFTNSVPSDMHLAVANNRQIYINTLFDSLITVFDFGGIKLRSFGTPFKHEQPATQHYWNIVSLDFDKEDNLWVVFHTRPIIRKYRKDGVLIFQIEPIGPEIEERKKQEKPMTSGLGRYVFYFTDIFCAPDGRIFVGGHNYIYEFNDSGEAKRRYLVNYPSDRELKQAFFISRFIYDIQHNLFWASSQFDELIFQIR